MPILKRLSHKITIALAKIGAWRKSEEAVEGGGSPRPVFRKCRGHNNTNVMKGEGDLLGRWWVVSLRVRLSEREEAVAVCSRPSRSRRSCRMSASRPAILLSLAGYSQSGWKAAVFMSVELCIGLKIYTVKKTIVPPVTVFRAELYQHNNWFNWFLCYLRFWPWRACSWIDRLYNTISYRKYGYDTTYLCIFDYLNPRYSIPLLLVRGQISSSLI